MIMGNNKIKILPLSLYDNTNITQLDISNNKLLYLDNNIINLRNLEVLNIANNKITTFRFKFSDEFITELSQFSKIHQFDDRHAFKDAWNTWVEDNEELVNIETRNLINNGYDGDVLDKMFKSARYYFRKKSTEKKAPVTRRTYINVDKQLLDAMDEHIMDNIDDEDYQPKNGFADFCQNNLEVSMFIRTQQFHLFFSDLGTHGWRLCSIISLL